MDKSTPDAPALEHAAAAALLAAAAHQLAAAPAEAPAALPRVRRDLQPFRFMRTMALGDGGGFNAGEIAGFPAAEADALVRSGAASFDLDAPAPTLSVVEQNSRSDVVRVEVIRAFGAYQPGETAGFAAVDAAALIKAGLVRKTNAIGSVVRRMLDVTRRAHGAG